VLDSFQPDDDVVTILKQGVCEAADATV